jgi:hypothetical protein
MEKKREEKENMAKKNYIPTYTRTHTRYGIVYKQNEKIILLFFAIYNATIEI